VKRISPNGVAALAKDVQYLSDFVDTLENPILQQNLDELRQTIALMQADNSDEYYDVSTRNKKYGRVDALNGPLLLEKCVVFFQYFDLVLIMFIGSCNQHKSTHARRNSLPFHQNLVIIESC
jgi:fumarate reductase subunit C